MLENLSANKKETIKKFVEEAFEFSKPTTFLFEKTKTKFIKRCRGLLVSIK